jgi:hypothetical protein
MPRWAWVYVPPFAEDCDGLLKLLASNAPIRETNWQPWQSVQHFTMQAPAEAWTKSGFYPYNVTLVS